MLLYAIKPLQLNLVVFVQYMMESSFPTQILICFQDFLNSKTLQHNLSKSQIQKLFSFINIIIILNMKAIILLALICTLTLQHQVLLISTTDNTIITYPANSYTVLDTYYEKYHSNFIGYNAKWIYKNGTGAWPVGDYATLYTKFYTSCQSDATLIITGDDKFVASVNGGSAYTGSNYEKIYKFTLKDLKCGENELKINVYNTGKNTPAAVIFAVIQDQSNCYKCASPLSYYNMKTCKCECLSKCSCPAYYAWYDYPNCGCKCKQYKQCPDYQYFNPYTCACECEPVACLPGYEQDVSTCKCKSKCAKVDCPDYKVWDSTYCKCVCAHKSSCPKRYSWDNYSCSCKKDY